MAGMEDDDSTERSAEREDLSGLTIGPRVIFELRHGCEEEGVFGKAQQMNFTHAFGLALSFSTAYAAELLKSQPAADERFLWSLMIDGQVVAQCLEGESPELTPEGCDLFGVGYREECGE
jgi:hypothetical protein